MFISDYTFFSHYYDGFLKPSALGLAYSAAIAEHCRAYKRYVAARLAYDNALLAREAEERASGRVPFRVPLRSPAFHHSAPAWWDV